ncbi:unnamed protein product, partial [Ilex paraguariensis]
CDIKSLEDSLFKRIIVTHDETITKWLDPESAVASRDALANCVVVNTFCIYPEDGEAPPSGVDDRTKLAYFHKPGVLHNLNSRYDVNEIYSYDQLRNQLVNMLSGESEVGETESTKLLMQYLAYLGGRAASEGRIVAQQVLESNPVLEAFALWSFVLVYLFQYLAYLGGRAESEGRTVEQQVLG